MANEPDSEADDYESIEVADTPERDNPKFGAVTLQVTRGNHSQTLRMTRADAQSLADKLTEHLNNYGKSN
jgi:hypothetical protein